MKNFTLAKIKRLIYEADFKSEKNVYTIDLLPQSQFVKKIGAFFKCEAGVGIEGDFQPANLINSFFESNQLLNGKASFCGTAKIGFAGKFSFTVLSPEILTVGFCSSKCQWAFQEYEKPLLGQQVMLQTVLVHPGTKKLDYRIRAEAHIKSNFVSFPASYSTQWLDVECSMR